MSTEVTLQTSTNSSNETELLAEQIGKNLRGGEVIELVSDLGGGKTTFVRGLAKGMGSIDNVASPTFTLSREYYTKDLVLHHFDFYRLTEAGIMAQELQEVIHKRDAVTVIEWADIAQGVLPVNRLTVHIKATGKNTRSYKLHCPKTLDYLLRGLK